MSKKKIISAIDVGDTKVCTLIAEVGDDGQMRIAGVGIVPSKGMHKGLISNINEAKEVVRDSVKRAEQSSGYRVESAFVGVTGHHISGHNEKGVVAVTHNDHLVRPDDLLRVLKIAQTSRLSSNQKILHMMPRYYRLDGQDGVQNPVGMNGFQLNAEAHVITAEISSVQDMVRCVSGAGVDVEDLVFDGLASSEAVLTEDDKQMGTIMADIGGGITNISVFKDGSNFHTAVIPVGGFQVSEDITVGLNLPFETAEEMKKKYGTAIPNLEEKPENDSISLNGYTISFRKLYDIIQARVEETLRLITLDLPRDEKGALVPGGLVLTGGGSNMAGIDTLAREVLKIPVRLGRPVNVIGIGEQLNAPEYSTVVGLLLWGIKSKTNLKNK